MKSAIQMLQYFLFYVAKEITFSLVLNSFCNEIINHQVPLLNNFSNALSVLSAQYDKTIDQFKSTVSETAADAIIDTDYLQGLLDGFSSIETNISTVIKQLQIFIAPSLILSV